MIHQRKKAGIQDLMAALKKKYIYIYEISFAVYKSIIIVYTLPTCKPLIFKYLVFLCLSIEPNGTIGIPYDLQLYHTLLDSASYDKWNSLCCMSIRRRIRKL